MRPVFSHCHVFCITLSTTIVATHSRTLAWKIPWMEGPDGLQSVGSQRVGHDWATSLLHVLLSSLVRGGRYIFPFYILYCLWAPLCEPGATLMSRPKAENPNFWGLKKHLSSYASSVCWQWNSVQFRGVDLYVPNLFGIWDFLPKTHTQTRTWCGTSKIEEMAVATPVSPVFFSLPVFNPWSRLGLQLVNHMPVRPSLFLKPVGLKSAVQSSIDWRHLGLQCL